MASSSSSSSSLSALLILLLTFQPILYVKSDEALISQLCKKTADPGTCLACLNSDPSSKKANPKGLALAAVACAKTDTASMYQAIFGLNALTPPNAPTKIIMEHCVSNTSVAVQDYDRLTSNVNRQAYGFAKKYIVQNVMPFSNACLKEFNQFPNLDVPSFIVSWTQTVNKDMKVMVGILNNI